MVSDHAAPPGPPPTFWHAQAFAWDAAHGEAVEGNQPSPRLHCASCQTNSLATSRLWSICACGLAYCGMCYSHGCEICGARVPARRAAPSAYGHDTAWDPSNGVLWQQLDADEVSEAAEQLEAAVFTPQEARSRRAKLLEAVAEARRDVKHLKRQTERDQIKLGLRPRRSRADGMTVTFATANVTSAERLKEEIRRGGELAQAGYIAVQELGLHGELIGEAEAWVKRAQWSGVLDAAYRKHGGYGGGTGIISRHPSVLRRIGAQRTLLRGRLSLGNAYFGFSVINASYYGISGAALSVQLPLWRELADALLALGRPFVVAGDWQRPPSDLRSSGLCEVLDAEVCSPPCATNLNSGGKLDYFLVSKSLLT